jgi:hypothetical protein
MAKQLLLLSLLLASSSAYGQLAAERADSLRAQAHRALVAKDFATSATLYVRQVQAEKYQSGKASAHYNAACAYAQANAPQQALRELKAAEKLGWHNAAHTKEDSDLISLRQLPQFKSLIGRMEQVEAKELDPKNAKLVTSDIDLFWKAYDLAAKNPTRKEEIYQREYFDKGSVGLQDYYTSKIKSTAEFVKNLERKPRFYQAIRTNTQRIASMTPQIRAGFLKLKELYPKARFPNVYFVIGRFNSGGTVSGNGLLVSADMQARSPEVPLDELSLRNRTTLGSIEGLPSLVAHEHIHYIQKDGGPDYSLLRGAINEGMADFLAELATDKNPNSHLQKYGAAHEKEIWADFKKEMTGNNWDNWIANGSQETTEKPADLGYFVGYKICQAYYEEMPDKKQAVYDILNIEDYPAFLVKSRYEEKLALR